MAFELNPGRGESVEVGGDDASPPSSPPSRGTGVSQSEEDSPLARVDSGSVSKEESRLDSRLDSQLSKEESDSPVASQTLSRMGSASLSLSMSPVRFASDSLEAQIPEINVIEADVKRSCFSFDIHVGMGRRKVRKRRQDILTMITQFLLLGRVEEEDGSSSATSSGDREGGDQDNGGAADAVANGRGGETDAKQAASSAPGAASDLDPLQLKYRYFQGFHDLCLLFLEATRFPVEDATRLLDR